MFTKLQAHPPRSCARPATRLVAALLALSVVGAAAPLATAGPATVVFGMTHSEGEMELAHSNQGWFGDLLNPITNWPSCEYPRGSNVEHLFAAGLWIGAYNNAGQTRVSTAADDVSASWAAPLTEFGPRIQDTITRLSSDPLSPFYSPSAMGHEQLQGSFDDEHGAGDPNTEFHEPLGLRVVMTSLVFEPDIANDFVMLRFEIENIGDTELRDVYVGWFSDFTVGNTTITPPGSATNGWNFYDDLYGYLGPGDEPNDPGLHMMHCHDEDGESGHATSWVGVRILGTQPETPVSAYRQWRFGQGPRFDADKYQWMSSGQFDVGMGEGGVDFGAIGNWSSMMAVGPWPIMAPGERIEFSIAVVAGTDRAQLLANSYLAQLTFDNDFQVPVSTRQGSWGGLKSRFRGD